MLLKLTVMLMTLSMAIAVEVRTKIQSMKSTDKLMITTLRGEGQ